MKTNLVNVLVWAMLYTSKKGLIYNLNLKTTDCLIFKAEIKNN